MEYKRVHGDIKIRRSSIEVDHYTKARSYLTKDFHNMCGYCGKQFDVIEAKGQIEHFIPKKKFPQFEHNYNNLILCCAVCNNKKYEDWPTNDASQNITIDGKKGYIDPATDDFDKNIVRTEDGMIVGITDVGQYMAKRFGFASRPMKECFKAVELRRLIDKLKEAKKINAELAALFIEYDELKHELFIRKENR